MEIIKGIMIVIISFLPILLFIGSGYLLAEDYTGFGIMSIFAGFVLSYFIQEGLK